MPRRAPAGRAAGGLAALLALGAAAAMTLIWPAMANAQAAAPVRLSGLVAAGAPPDAAALDQAQSALRRAASGRNLEGLTDAQLKARLAAVPPIQATLASLMASLVPRLQDADARLAQLGPAPAAGQPPEPAQTAETRRQIERYRQQTQARLAQARLLDVECDQLSAALAEQIRANFAARLWKQNRSVLDPGLWRDFAAAAPDDVRRVGRAMSDEAERIVEAGRASGSLGAWAMAAALALLLVWPGRMVLGRLGRRRAEALGEPTRLARTLLALWLVAVSVATPLVALAVARAALDGGGALTPLADRATMLVIAVTGFATLMEGLGRAILSPRRAAWRIAPLPDSLARRLAPYPGLVAAAVALATLAAGFDSLLGVGLSTSVAVDCVVLILELAAVGAGLAMLGRARIAAGEPSRGTGGRAGPEGSSSPLPWILAAVAAWLALGVVLAAVLLGYLALAGFIMRETVWIATVLASLFLLLRLADDLFPALMSPGGVLGRAIRTGIGVSEGALEQIGVLLSGLTRLALLLVAWALVLAPFGTSAGNLSPRLTSIDTTFRVGQVLVSPAAIFGAIGLFLAGLLFTHGVRGWLVARYLPKTRLDAGLRASLASGVSYLGVLVAVVFAFAYLGLSLSQIALFAGALSVGIGFGLQAIIGNFVSGLILLAERPVRVGDWIAIGELEGDVKRISIRATEIEMADRSRLIVPNSDLISKTVRNVTHTASIGRVKIVLVVTNGTEPEAMRALLAGVFAAHREVLKEPKPAVYLSDVRDGDLEFTALAYVASARMVYRVKSELLFQIVPALKRQGVALASASPVVNIGLSDRLVDPAAGEGVDGRDAGADRPTSTLGGATGDPPKG